MNHDGTKQGFAIDITKRLAEELPVPVIASGGGGNLRHFEDVFEQAHADAALAAGITGAVPHQNAAIRKALGNLLGTASSRHVNQDEIAGALPVGQ